MTDLYDIEPFAMGFLNADRDDLEYRVACGMKTYAERVKLNITPSEWFVGVCEEGGDCAVFMSRGGGMAINYEKKEKNLNSFPQYADELNDIYAKFELIRTERICSEMMSDEDRIREDNKCCWGRGSGHSNPDYKMLLEKGSLGMRKKIERFGKVHADKKDFYDALELTVDALDIFAERYKNMAQDMLSEASGDDAVVLHRLIKAFENVPQNEPRDFFEACVFFWLAFSSMNSIDSPGLFDLFMGKYYEAHTDKEDRYFCLKKLWELFKKTRTWNLCIGGSDEFGNDWTNDLSYDVLRVAREYKWNTPNITMRVHDNTPDELWLAAVETLATGIGMPAIYNDNCVCTAYEALGIPASDSHMYCMNGCNQIDIFGKSHMGLEDGEVSVIKCLEMALFNGVCQYTKLKLGIETGDAREFKTFDELMNAYYRQIENLGEHIVRISNNKQEIFAKTAPMPWLSVVIQGCIEKGLDYKNRGPFYGHAQVLTEGMPDTADSLAAIKHYIFDEKKYTMAQLLDALEKDFEGYDELYNDFSTWHKFGNDLDDVDEIYSNIQNHIYRFFQTKKTFRGGFFGVGCSTFNRAHTYGIHCGALPNGKKKDDSTLADSIGAVPGCDKNGPTALLNSVLKSNQYLATSGNVMQIKFNKSQFETTVGKNAFIALAKTYFAQGGQTLQINVVSQEELLDAMKHPEKHGDLIVRVGGYSDYFVRLAIGLKENIIKRAQNTM